MPRDFPLPDSMRLGALSSASLHKPRPHVAQREFVPCRGNVNKDYGARSTAGGAALQMLVSPEGYHDHYEVVQPREELPVR